MKKLLLFVALAACAVSNASTWHEGWHGSGDAGDLPASADITTGTAGLTAISGRCATGNDVDVYKIKIFDNTIVNISTVGGAGGADTLLCLFDSAGMGIVAADDIVGAESTIDSTLVTAPGDYYIAISRWNRTASNGSGVIWSSYTGQQAPNGPGAALPVAGWTNSVTTLITYTMTLAGCDPAVIGADETMTTLESVILDADAIVGGGAALNGTVYLSAPAPAGGTLVSLSSSSASASVPASVTVAEAAASATFAVTTALVSSDTSVTITATASGDTRSDTLLLTALPASLWVEDRPDYPAAANHGDAGTLLPTAQMTSGSGALNQIAGRFTASDIDLYCIEIADFAAFTASCLNGGDTILFLFNSAGLGVVMNDDNPAGGLGSVLTSAFVTANGKYYLGVCRYSGRPNGNATPDPIWIVGTPPFNLEKAPDGAGAALPLDNWTNLSAATSNYTINMTGVEFCEKIIAPTSLVPGPGSILAGGIAEASTSNDQRVRMRPGAILVATADPLVLQVVGTAPAATATSIKVQVESRATVANVRQIVEARNFAAGAGVWDNLETFVGLPTGANPDRVVTFTLANPNDYIGPSNEIRFRIKCKNTTAVLVYPWQAQFDEVTWRIVP